MTLEFHKVWLKITAFIVGSFGPIFFLGSMAPTAEPARFTMDLLSWPLDNVQTFAEPTTRFLSALAGGFLLGWGVLIWFLSGEIYDKSPEPIRKAVLASTFSWFALDTAGSVFSGNPSNAFFNLLILFAAIGPLWRPPVQ